MHSSVNQLKQYILQSDNIVFFGGAGVSTASGIPDFRSADGLFSERLNRSFTPEQLVSRTFYERYPEDFLPFTEKNCSIQTPGRTPAILRLPGWKPSANYLQ